MNLNLQTADGLGLGPQDWVLRSDADGFAADLASWNNGGLPQYSHFVTLISDPNFQNSAAARAFRLYGFNSSGYIPSYQGGLGGTGNDLSINGVVTIPEPVSWALLGIGTLAFGLLRRRATS